MPHPCDSEPDGCWHLPGYLWCEPCGEHHRPPQCAIDQDGHALAPCGCRWDVIDPPGSHVGPYVNRHRPGCVDAPEEHPHHLPALHRVGQSPTT